MKKPWLAAALSVLLSASPALPQAAPRTVSNTAARVQFVLPNNWTDTAQGTATVLREPSLHAVIELHPIVSTAQLQSAAALMQALVAQHFSAVTTQPNNQSISQNGLRGAMRQGTGTANGAQVGFLAGVIAHQSGGVMIIAWVEGPPASFTQHLPAIQTVLSSISYVRPAAAPAPAPPH